MAHPRPPELPIRPRRLRTAALALGLTALAGVGCGRGGEPAPDAVPRGSVSWDLLDSEGRRPNFLVIDVDSLRLDRVGMERDGAPIAPTLAALAREGTSFDAASAQSGWTIPSLQALLTGRWPVLVADRTGPDPTRVLPVVPAGQRTLAEILSAYGYRTAAFWGGTVPHVIQAYWQGFAEVHEYRPERVGAGPLPGYGAEIVPWLEAGPPEPFFALLHEMDLHHPRPEVPAAQAHRYAPDLPPDLTQRLDELARALSSEGADDAAVQAQVIAVYDAFLAAYDQELARLLATLDETGLRARTVVVLTSNHGEELFEAGRIGHVDSYRETLLRVPLILAHPGLEAGREVQDPVQGIDLAPTLLALAGIPTDRSADGRSLLAALAPVPTPLPRQPQFFQNGPGEGAYRKGKLKLVLRPMARPDASSLPATCARHLLFDLTQDPAERRERCAERGAVAEEMAAQLDPWVAARDRAVEGVPFPEASEAQRELMRRRGYWKAGSED